MYDAKLINKILRRAEKSSIMQAAREFGVGYNTIKRWQSAKEQAVKNAEGLISTPDFSELMERPERRRLLKQQAYAEFTANSDFLSSIQYKKINTASLELPKYILAAYDLKSGLFNFCFTYESNKNNKALYLLYLNDFYRSNRIINPVFITNLKLNGVKTAAHQGFNRMIEIRINKLLDRLESFIADNSDISQLLFKSFIFLADNNLSIGAEKLTHPPFVLEDNIANFDFRNNSLMINTISVNAQQSIMAQIAGLQKDQLNTSGLNSEQLLKIYDFFSSRKIDSKQLENKLIDDAGKMQLMGDLSKSDQFLQVLVKSKSLTDSGRIDLYLLSGMLKFRKSDYDAACKLYQKAVFCSRKSSNLKAEYQGLYNYCSLYLERGMSGKAYRYLRMVQRLAYQIKSDRRYAQSYFLAGMYHYVIENYALAAKNYQQAAEISEKIGEYNNCTNALSETANCFIELKQYKKAFKFAKIALDRNLANGLKIPLAISYFYCASACFHLGEFGQSREYILKQLDVLADSNYPVMEYPGRELYYKLLLVANEQKQASVEYVALQAMVAKITNTSIIASFTALEKPQA